MTSHSQGRSSSPLPQPLFDVPASEGHADDNILSVVSYRTPASAFDLEKPDYNRSLGGIPQWGQSNVLSMWQ